VNKKHKVKPNFLIIGAPGTATDSLSTLISLHPEGGIASAHQPSFFSVDEIYKVGWKKYLRLFEHCEGKRAVGEASVNYSLVRLFPKVLDRIKEHMPHARIIYMVRHPLERIENAYFERMQGPTQLKATSFSEAVRNQPAMVDATRYWEVFDAYRSRFGYSQIRIVWFEEYARHTKEVFQEVCRFLGIDYTIEPDLTLDRANPRLSPAERVVRTGSLPTEVDTGWEAETRRWVIDQIREDNCRFLQHFGKPLNYWGDLFREADGS
jgi:hypothetical protein